MLESGEHALLTELAKLKKINISYLCRMLRLTLLAPDIVEALLNGHTTTFCFSRLLQPTPLFWGEQRTQFEKRMTG